MSTKSCYTCGYRTLNPQQCPLINYQYAEDRNISCPYYTKELIYCSKCGNIMPKEGATFNQTDDNTWKPICHNCISLFGHCGGCSKSTVCDFETNPSPIPKAVQKQVQQGGMITIIQQRNPSRIDITCRVNCPCFSEEFGCLRDNNTCSNYEE